MKKLIAFWLTILLLAALLCLPAGAAYGTSPPETVSEAFSNALSKQPSVVRRKDTINNASGAFLQIASLLTTVSAGLPLWVSAILAAIIGIVQILFSATTEGPLAPSQERKIIAEIKKIDKPEVAKAGALNTLLNIFDAVEIERAKEREKAEKARAREEAKAAKKAAAVED